MTKDLETGGVKQVSKHIFETIRTEVLKEQSKYTGKDLFLTVYIIKCTRA